MIPLEQDAVSITAAGLLRTLFAQDDRPKAKGVAAVLGALVSLLGEGAQRH